MKRMKIFLLVAVILATSAAFTTSSKKDCSTGPFYHYVGTNPDPVSDPTNFEEFAENGRCDASTEAPCTYYKEGETFIECPEVNGVYVETPLK